MNAFNKLYNLILESIISQNAESRKAMLLKGGFDQGAANDVNRFLKKYDNKTADFLCRYIANKEITKVNDERLNKVQKILKLNSSLDTQSLKGNIDQFIKQYYNIVQKNQQKQNAKTVQYLDSIPEFSQKKQYPNGVVIYQVEDSSKGMRAVRKIIDLQWGQDANPWCLAARTGKNKDLRAASRHWKQYNSYPKHIAFQNGKLIAFSANDKNVTLWWDREDHPHHTLPLLDGTFLRVDPLVGPSDIFEKYKNLHLNPETNRYDCDGSIRITDEFLTDGHFSIPFGVINGEFNCNDCETLQSLENAPTEVKGEFNCGYNKVLKSLKGMPQKIGRGIFIAGDYALEDLEGMPEVCHGPFQAYGMKNLKSLKGCSQIIKDNCYIQSDVLQSLQGGPQKVKGNFQINGCIKLKNLKSAPEFIGGELNCYKCVELQSLEGIKVVKGPINTNECPKLNNGKRS